MRRKDREITQVTELLEIIKQCKVCRVGMIDAQGVYIVPMNFGYSYEEDQLTLFFHSAKEGRKINALQAQKSVCFEMDCEHKLLEAATACKYGYSYKSIMGNGTVSFIEESSEKEAALQALMHHQCNQHFSFNDTMTKNIAVFKIEVTTFTGKAHE